MAAINKHRPVKFLMLVLLTSHSSVFAQNFKGKVVDKETGQPLAYANIGIIGKNIGGISFQNGEFSINLSGAERRDFVRISYIGYESDSTEISKLELNRYHTIALVPRSIQLNPIVVSEKMETHNIGNQKVGRTYTGSGDFQSLRGRTRGLLIEGMACPVRIKSFFFRINHNDWDSVAFRLNFMKVENGKGYQTVLQRNIFFTTSMRHKWVKVDVEDYNVILCSNTIVTLEWVDAWGSVGTESNLLTLSLSKNSGQTYLREPGEEAGSLSTQEHAPAMYVEVFGK